MDGSKVFCIGFHKTGTTSLANALTLLGYRVTGPNGVRDPEIAQNVHSMAFDLAEKFDAFQDNPWPILYREMDLRFPGSKFILTLRDSQSWIKSQVKHFGEKETPMRRWIYGVGCPVGNEETYIQRYEKHNREVLAHFKDRSKDFMTLDLSHGDGWEQLCRFLGKDVPDVEFPHANKAADRERKQSSWFRMFRRLRLRKAS
ncbi:sulfotransferase family protein [Thalassoglobus sp. JC818]|uniref:sulfotransferase family protein n=1 Tax=Thalassoglobus sp. JC818 TaxID=3232136 RepID=UPI003457E538